LRKDKGVITDLIWAKKRARGLLQNFSLYIGSGKRNFKNRGGEGSSLAEQPSLKS